MANFFIDRPIFALNMRFLFKMVLFPVSLFVAFLALMAKWLLTLSSYIVAPLMLYIFGCGIYTASASIGLSSLSCWWPSSSASFSFLVRPPSPKASSASVNGFGTLFES